MRFEIERINEENYPGFDDMVFWREYIAKIVEWMFG